MSAGSQATQSGDRRQALVLAAYHRIAERGFEGLRTRDVAAEVGLNVATLHYWFPTKEDLIRGVVEHAMSRFRSTLTARVSPANQLHGHLHAVRRLLTSEPELGAVMAELALRSARDSGIAEIVRETQEAWHRTLRGLLGRAVRQGQLAPELDSDEVAAAVMAILTSMTLPNISSAERADQALHQLEHWLGVATAPAGD